MKPYLDDGDVRVYVGDARAVLADLEEASVHAILCSPPFWGLRDYGTAEWEGGDPAHDHVANGGRNSQANQGRPAHVAGGPSRGGDPTLCDCGAIRVDEQIGLEATPDAWADALVEVFAEARRVLRDDGSLWIEVGDSYAGAGVSGSKDFNERWYGRTSTKTANPGRKRETRVPTPGDLKPKDLVLAPFLLALALRADGWWLRGVYVWEKPDAMPESTRDRCTVSHSYVLHLAKQRRYYFDLEAIREPFSDYSSGGNGGSYGAAADSVRPPSGGPRGSTEYLRPKGGVAAGQLDLAGDEPALERVGADGRTVTTRTTGGLGHDNYQDLDHDDGRERWPSLDGRSPRSVWRIPTEATSFGLCPVCRAFWDSKAPEEHCGVPVVAHFAAWPHELVRRVIACSTSEQGVCGECGAPRVRLVKREQTKEGDTYESQMARAGAAETPLHQPNRPDTMWQVPRRSNLSTSRAIPLGWEPSCDHDAPTIPATVLDPFGGSGTTARQARSMGRHAVLIELNPDYAEIASHRLAQLGLGLVAS